MKNATQCAKRLTALLRKLPDPAPMEIASQDDPVAVLIESFLLSDSTTEKAQAALRRLRQHVVDFNDLRVTMPQEMVEYLGSRYPGAPERCQRIRRALRDVYLREHNVTLERLKTAGKRDVRSYIESLGGMVPYVGARVLALSFDAHAVPVDKQLRDALVANGAADETADLGEISAWLARHVKAGDAVAVHQKLQAWIDRGALAPGSKQPSRTTAAGAANAASPKKTPAGAKSPLKAE